MSRTAKLILATIAAGGLGLLVMAVQFNRFLHSPLDIAESGVGFEIKSGSTFRTVGNDLAAAGIVEQPTWLRWYARVSGKASRIHAGEYLIESGTTPAQLVELFVSGAVRLYSFTIVEGWTYRELLSALAADPVVQKTMEYDDWPSLLEQFGDRTGHPEGLFLPETYRFPKDTRDVDLLRQAYDLLQQTLADEWRDREADLPIDSAYEALVLASIIEKETALASERPRISGVFVRRLQRRMRLQTDPTVIYGIGTEFNGNLTRRDLKTDTPYNTYTRHGLPPTPIALAGKAAIRAALHPASGSEVFFVATALGDGSHKFSDTKEQHDAAVQEYLVRLRAARRQ